MASIDQETLPQPARQEPSPVSLRKMIGLAALAIGAGVVAAVCWRVDDWSRDWTENSAAATYQISHSSVAQVAAAVQQWTEQQSGWTVHKVAKTESESGDQVEMHLTRQTSVFHFTDDIHVTILATDEGVRVDARSQSRVGKGDLGQNPRNLSELSDAWKALQPST